MSTSGSMLTFALLPLAFLVTPEAAPFFAGPLRDRLLLPCVSLAGASDCGSTRAADKETIDTSPDSAICGGGSAPSLEPCKLLTGPRGATCPGTGITSQQLEAGAPVTVAAMAGLEAGPEGMPFAGRGTTWLDRAATSMAIGLVYGRRVGVQDVITGCIVVGCRGPGARVGGPESVEPAVLPIMLPCHAPAGGGGAGKGRAALPVRAHIAGRKSVTAG
jgi:hypothetical protein